MSTTIPALTSVTDILDNDLAMITHSNGESFKIAGSEINKRNQAVIASTTTMTGAPLKTGNIVRVYFTADITGSNTTTGLVINYNNVNYSVKVPKNGTLANFVASDLGGSPAVYKYLQANTMLELLYDGTQFIIIGNPLVLSGSGYEIHADGMGKVNSVAANNMNAVTSNAVASGLSQRKALITSTFYSSTNNSGFALMASAFCEGASGNRDVAITGSFYYSLNATGRTLYAFDFLLSARYTNSDEVLPVVFRVVSKDGNTRNVSSLFTATYKIGSDRSIYIFLYAKIAGPYNRYICVIDNLFYGDVYPLQSLPNNNLDMTTSYVTSIPSDQTTIPINAN